MTRAVDVGRKRTKGDPGRGSSRNQAWCLAGDAIVVDRQ